MPELAERSASHTGLKFLKAKQLHREVLRQPLASKLP